MRSLSSAVAGRHGSVAERDFRGGALASKFSHPLHALFQIMRSPHCAYCRRYERELLRRRTVEQVQSVGVFVWPFRFAVLPSAPFRLRHCGIELVDVGKFFVRAEDLGLWR